MTRNELIAASARGMLMSTPMVQATFADEKGRTMRAMKPQPEDICPWCESKREHVYPYVTLDEHGKTILEGGWYITCKKCDTKTTITSPKHSVGDIIYVKEKHRFVDFEYIDGTWSAQVQYAADEGYRLTRLFWGNEDDVPRLGWRPSMFMPKAAARLFIRITGVKAQRPWELTYHEMLREGIERKSCVIGNDAPCDCDWCVDQMQQDWCKLWDSVQQKKALALYGYAKNPFCWVYEFERVVPDDV